MSGRPLISVIVPAHDCERYIRESLESVLAQRYEPLELIVVDDGSTDLTSTVVNQLREEVSGGAARKLKLIRQQHAGVASALNHGLAVARGELLAFLDADDLWAHDKFERQLPVVEAGAHTELVFGWVEQFHSPELSDADRAAIRCPRPGPGKLKGAMLCWRDSFDRVGSFDTDLPVGDFIDWYARACEAGLQPVVVPEIVLRRRLHKANGTRSSNYLGYARALAAARRRRRLASGESIAGH